MRKYILFLFFLGALSAARGQTGWQYDYWFDNDRSTLQTGSSNVGSFQLDADVSGLSEGLHSINIQMTGNGTNILGLGKDDGGNRVVNSELLPMLSSPVSRYFVKASESTTARCWYDNDPTTVQTGVQTGEPLMLDVTALKDGFHLINIQSVGADGGLSAPKSYPFIKIPQVLGIDRLTCLCMIDDQFFKEEVPANNGVVTWNFDVSMLSQGFHRLFVQVVTPSGAATNLYQGFFFRETTRTEFGEMKCVYAIDGGNFDNVAGTLANGTYHFDLDVASLSDGLHRLSYMLSNGKGITTKVQTQFFTKIPLGGYGTVEYWYWLNDQSGDQIQKVKVNPRQNPYNVIASLPISEVDLRSSQFAFAVENGKPYIYAKNTFHARFYDASGRFVDMNKDFVDPRVKREVSGMTVLQSAATAQSKSMSKPVSANNDIHWYQMNAKAGDSLQFRLDRPATLQLFSPSGNEVYRVEGATSLKWGGLHAEENGAYYLAVHDATYTYNSNLNLNYEFIDRYAVLRQDVTKVGNGGPSTITFSGNGYDKLQKVELVKDGTTIISDEISSESKAVTSVKFNFDGKPLGVYKAIFYFNDGGQEETVTVENCITVETAVPSTFDTTVSFPPRFLVSRGADFVFRITNHGNMTAYDHKMQLRIFTENMEDLLEVIVDNIPLLNGTQQTSELISGLPCMHIFDIIRQMRPSFTEICIVHIKTAGVGPVHVMLDDVGGGSVAVASLDPNDIYGYQDEYGSKVIRGGLTDVYYTIEFENDPEFATAPAHDIYITDVLDPTLFNLNTYKPTRIQIGDKSVELEGNPNFVTTIDMRPAINAVAQVEGTFNAETGEASWHISSLDPMTAEPTTVLMDGVLPVNNDGDGIGKLSFDISLKPGLPIDTEIPNQASIQFDDNDVIMTPTWVNTIGDAILMGDVNGDGEVTITDAVAMISYVLGENLSDFNAAAADVNGDGKVTVADVVAVIGSIKKAN